MLSTSARNSNGNVWRSPACQAFFDCRARGSSHYPSGSSNSVQAEQSATCFHTKGVPPYWSYASSSLTTMQNSWLPHILRPDFTWPTPTCLHVSTEMPSIPSPQGSRTRLFLGLVHNVLARFSKSYCHWFGIPIDGQIMELPFGLILKRFRSHARRGGHCHASCTLRGHARSKSLVLRRALDTISVLR